MSNPNSTKLASLKHVVLLELSLTFSVFITLRKTKLPVNANKIWCMQSRKEMVRTEFFVFRKYHIFISQPEKFKIYFIIWW